MKLTHATLLIVFACRPQPAATTGTPEPVVAQMPDPDLTPAMGDSAPLAESPTRPKTEDGRTLTWVEAPQMGQVTTILSRDSAVIEVPIVEGALDYRAYRLTAGVTLDGTQVLGGDVTCAGYRQRNVQAPAARELLRRIEVPGLDDNAVVVVEALDKPCPFVGAFGKEHVDIEVTSDEVVAADRINYSLFTEAEIRAKYGSLIRNGHGPASLLAQQADVALAKPKVLARTTLLLKPQGYAGEPPTNFFDDFANSDDQPTFVSDVDDAGRSQRGKLYRNSKWSFYTYGADPSQFFIEKGQLHTVLNDWAQNIFSTNIAYPRQPVQLDDDKYLKVVFDVASDATARRYWWSFVCGAETAGQTMNTDGTLKGKIVQTSFFYQADGRNPSVEGWNCFQLFARDGWPFDLEPSNKQPESDIRVMVNTANAPERDSVVNVSPDQYKDKAISQEPGWFRQQNAAGQLLGPIMDDQLLIAPRTKIVMYLKRDRVVLYINGEQRLCNDFPTHKLTMAEGALGFGQVLYHTTAERLEFSRDYWMRTGQRYYLENTPYVDARTWDNMGYTEHLPAPANLDTSKCFVSP